MFNAHSSEMFAAYNKAREYFIRNWGELVEVEKYTHSLIKQVVIDNLAEIRRDYDEASYLHPFWQNYPPEERGRSPRGDQFPWIEVGEHSVGFKLARLISNRVLIREIGLPSGTDQRFVLKSKELGQHCKITNQAMLFVDVKSVGPRDDADHTVLSTYQVSGDGIWKSPKAGVKNSVMTARGSVAAHAFHCALPPIYVLSDCTIAPTVSVFIKPVYRMLALDGKNQTGQPLQRITIVTLPNGLLLSENPGYLTKYPELFYPGKDDKSKAETKLRARVSFEILRKIEPWRVETIPLA
jgi:Restriction endonuclease BglI